jgi:hypothetical protein
VNAQDLRTRIEDEYSWAKAMIAKYPYPAFFVALALGALAHGIVVWKLW